MRRMIPALILSAAVALPIVAPVTARADEHREHERRVHRVYDPYRRDYHRWDRDEDRAYREYLAERHRAYVAYERQRAAERRAYWRWRHEREERLEHERGRR